MRQLHVTITIAVYLGFSPLLGVGLAAQMAFPGTEWETASPESQLLHASGLEAAVDYLAANTPASGDRVNMLTIIRNGRMIWEGPRIDLSKNVYSITKSITSSVLGLLVDDGRATLDTLAADYMPSLAADYPEVTFRHITTMTSGYRAVGETPPYDLSDTPLTPDTPYFTPPGSQFYYSNGTAMEPLSNALTQIAHEPIEDLFRRRIADPIGLTGWRWLTLGGQSPPGGPLVNRGS